MLVGVILSFVVVFALVVIAGSGGIKFFEARRKHQMADMLQTATGDAPVPISKLLKELEGDRAQGLGGLTRNLQVSQRLQQQLQQAGLDWKVNRLYLLMAGGAVAGAVLGVVFPRLINPAISALVASSLLGMAPYFYVRRARTKRLDMLEEQFPESLDFLARSMRAGHAFSISLEMVGEEMPEPLGQEYRTLFNEQNLGAPLEVALGNFGERVPLLDVRFFTSSVLLQRQTGGNLSEILSRLAYVIRERFRLKGQVRAASAHGRITATILVILPIATMAGLLLVAPGYLEGMAKEVEGRWMIGGAIVGQLLGNYVMKRIINIKV
jgi:tight adherence protein B